MTDIRAETSKAKRITLRQLVHCSLEQQLKVREIRNQSAVRSSMYTDHEISLSEHLGWIHKLKADKRQIVFAVIDGNDEPIGVVSVNALDLLHKKSDWAFYLGEDQRGGLGAALEYHLIEYVFNSLELEKLNCEVIETNEAVVKLHKKFHFKEEGFRRLNINKNGKRIGVFFLGLTKEDWVSNRNDVLQKYESILHKYDIQIEAATLNKEENLEVELEKVMTLCNLNWLEVFALAKKQNPQATKLLAGEILDTELKKAKLLNHFHGDLQANG